jgi:hypothetical protein
MDTMTYDPAFIADQMKFLRRCGLLKSQEQNPKWNRDETSGPLITVSPPVRPAPPTPVLERLPDKPSLLIGDRVESFDGLRRPAAHAPTRGARTKEAWRRLRWLCRLPRSIQR